MTIRTSASADLSRSPLYAILVNMFTENNPDAQAPENRRPVGRPRGRTAAGLATRESLYAAAVQLISERGYEAATLRDIA